MASEDHQHSSVVLPPTGSIRLTKVLSLILYYCLTTCSTCIFQVNASTAAGQDTLVGIVGKDFVLLGADSSCSLRGTIALTASNVDKIYVISNPAGANVSTQRQQQHCIAAAAAGNPADSDRLLGLLRAHATVREYEHGVGCDVACVFDGGGEEEDTADPRSSSTSSYNNALFGLDARAVAHLARTEISSSLRTAAPLQICLLVAGMLIHDDDDGGSMRSLQPSLFWLDNTGFMQRVSYGAHGYGSNFLWSILDRDYRPNMSKEEAYGLLKSCFQQLRTRYVINTGPYPPCIKCLDAINGCTTIQ
jgi:20S proteasome alpha/beta subunit